jgi:CRISPR-associated protein Csd1
VILQRLYALAQREKLLDDPAFEIKPVPFAVQLDERGKYLGLKDLRSEALIPSKKKGGEPKRVLDKGQMLRVPCSHGNRANQGFARYFVDTLPRVLPLVVEVKDQAKADASRKTFWQQIDEAADTTNDSSLKAVQAFGRRFDEFTDQIRNDITAKDPALTDRVTFVYTPGGGKTILDEDAVHAWYATIFQQLSSEKQADGPIGVCQVTGRIGPLPTSHPMRLQGVPGGMSVGVSLISFDKPAFAHYGLDGAANAGVGYEAADGYLRALTALLGNNLPSVKQKGGKSNLRVGGTAFLYWTKDVADLQFMSLLDDPSEEAMKQLPKPRVKGGVANVFGAATSGKKSAATQDVNQFYMLGLSGNAARAVVRGYLENTLGEVKQNLAEWFADLRIADTSKNYAGSPNDMFPLWQLALATAFDSDAVAPDTSERLLTAALTGGPLPESLLVSCIRRLMADGANGFRASRMALIKLILTRREVSVTETLNADERHPAYVYGRLLSVFESIQYAALGDVNANVVDKFYGTMSSAPGMVFGRLQDNARNHLRKIRGEKPRAAVALEKRMMEICGLLVAAPPPVQCSLQDQGRFALGYYHEKAKRFEEAAERTAEKTAKAEAK